MSGHFDLDRQVEVVTGGGRGIGCAVGLANAGAAVVPSARFTDEIGVVAEEVRSNGNNSNPNRKVAAHEIRRHKIDKCRIYKEEAVTVIGNYVLDRDRYALKSEHLLSFHCVE